MSELRGMLILSPPERGIIKQEHIVSPNVCPCPRCHGNGWYWNYEDRDGIKVDCPVCDGSGRLRPIIDIEWEPDI